MTIGVVIVTHYSLGEEFLQALRLIVPDGPEFGSVAIQPNQPVHEMREAISAALRKRDTGSGVLILTDMFGGTPSNMSLSFLGEHHVEVVTGINLPMLIKFTNLRTEMTLKEAAAEIASQGRESIHVASELLESAGGAGENGA